MFYPLHYSTNLSDVVSKVIYAFKLKIVLYWEDDIYVDMCVYRFILKTVHLMKSTNKCNRFDTNG